MSDSKIKCPNCGTDIDVEDILTHQVEEEIKKKYNQQLIDQKRAFEEKEKELQKRNEEFEEKKKKQNELFQEKLEEQLKKDKEEQRLKLQKQLQEENEERIKLKDKELAEKTEKLKELLKAQAEVEQLKREKAEATEKANLEAEKKLNEQLSKAKEEIQKQTTESFQLKEKEYQKQLEDAKKSAEDLKRKMEQGSMQLQGEVQELMIEEELQSLFPFDQIDEVSKGIRGADCVQTVINQSQEVCGKIIYESKRTQNFAGDWIPKLKSDMLSAGADVAVLITQTLPKDQRTFSMVDGVWVCSFTEFKSLAAVLRDGIIKINATRSSNENKGDKMQMLYDYLTGNEFRHQVEAIVEAFSTMKANLDKEKRQALKNWKEREKQIDKVIENTIGMHGTVKGIAGSSVKSIKALEFDDDLPELDEEGDD